MPSVKQRNESALEIARAIIYARVSKDDAGGRSCREQIKACEGDCEYEGWTVALVLQDNDRGATRHSKGQRLEFQKLPDVLRKGDVLVVWEPSRITREPTEFGPFCDMVAARGVLIYYDGRTYDMNDDDDRARVWQDILDGAKAAGKTRKRVLRAISTNREEFKPQGKRAAGYRVTRDERTGQSTGRVVDPGEAAVIRKAAELALDPDPRVSSLYNISRELSADWIAAGGNGRFREADVKRILTNPTTFGLYAHKGEILGKGQWDPVLDPELKPTLAAALDRGTGVTRGNAPVHLLSCIAECAVCVEKELRGFILYRRKTSKRGYSTQTYYCSPHNHVVRSEARVDVHVQEVLMRWLEAPDAAARLSAPIEVSAVAPVSVDDELATIARIRKEIDDYLTEAAETRMSARAQAIYVVPLEDEIRAAQERINTATAAVDPLILDSLGPDARANWKTRTIEEKRSVIRTLARVTIHPVRGSRGVNAEVGVTMLPRFNFM